MFDEDAHVIELLDKAGAILIGKLSMVELAGGGGYRFPSASLTGPGLNPWDQDALERRIVQRPRIRDCGGVGHVLDWIGNVGIDPDAQRLLRHHRIAADLRTGQPPRGDGAFLDAR